MGSRNRGGSCFSSLRLNLRPSSGSVTSVGEEIVQSLTLPGLKTTLSTSPQSTRPYDNTETETGHEDCLRLGPFTW